MEEDSWQLVIKKSYDFVQFKIQRNAMRVCIVYRSNEKYLKAELSWRFENA